MPHAKIGSPEWQAEYNAKQKAKARHDESWWRWMPWQCRLSIHSWRAPRDSIFERGTLQCQRCLKQKHGRVMDPYRPAE